MAGRPIAAIRASQSTLPLQTLSRHAAHACATVWAAFWAAPVPADQRPMVSGKTAASAPATRSALHPVRAGRHAPTAAMGPDGATTPSTPARHVVSF